MAWSWPRSGGLILVLTFCQVIKLLTWCISSHFQPSVGLFSFLKQQTVACEQQWHRSACTSVQIDQCLCYSLIVKYIGAATWDFQQCGILTSVGSDQPVKPTFKLRNSKWCSVSSVTLRILKRLAKALTRLHICAGWSEAYLVAHTTLLEISCPGSY